jgi:hypothetical protein
MLKATFGLDRGGRLEVAPEQIPIELADRYTGEPGRSSVAYASDLSINKPGTDVAVLGHAYPQRPNDAETSAGIEVGPIQKLVKVFGDRFWSRTVGIAHMSRPLPFERMPLVYERAFGGEDLSPPNEKHHEAEARNPIGVGFRAKKSQLPIGDSLLPNIEDPRAPMSGPDDRPAPAGLGFIAPSWQPRAGYAGTYDEAWEKSRKPLLPLDFSERFFQAAHPDLAGQDFLKGDEDVMAIGVSPDGPLRFSLPGVRPLCSVEQAGPGEIPVMLRLDRVVLEPDDRRLLLVWSGTLRIPSLLQHIDLIRFNLMN